MSPYLCFKMVQLSVVNVRIDIQILCLSTVPLPPRIVSVRRVDRNEPGGVVLHALDITVDFTVSS